MSVCVCDSDNSPGPDDRLTLIHDLALAFLDLLLSTIMWCNAMHYASANMHILCGNNYLVDFQVEKGELLALTLNLMLSVDHSKEHSDISSGATTGTILASAPQESSISTSTCLGYQFQLNLR